MEKAGLKSFVEYSETNHFPLENIPFGVCIHPQTSKHICCTRIGDFIIDLAALETEGVLKTDVFKGEKYINKFMEGGKDLWHSVRVAI